MISCIYTLQFEASEQVTSPFPRSNPLRSNRSVLNVSKRYGTELIMHGSRPPHNLTFVHFTSLGKVSKKMYSTEKNTSS